MTLSFCARRVDGLIIVPAGTDHRYLLPEIEAGIAAVFVDRPAGLIDADMILSDNEGGAYTGVNHLIRHGHRAIGFIGDSADIYTAGLRHRGYREAMRSAGLRVDESWVVLAPPEASGIARALARMITGPTPVTALFCGNNRSTVLVLRELARMGRRPGAHGREGAGPAGDLAVAGFDDFELADMITPPITVVAQDPGEMGRLAAELLFRRLAGERGPAQRITLSTHLIVRGSGEVPPRLRLTSDQFAYPATMLAVSAGQASEILTHDWYVELALRLELFTTMRGQMSVKTGAPIRDLTIAPGTRSGPRARRGRGRR
jgi:LacI family transcriptional regulator